MARLIDRAARIALAGVSAAVHVSAVPPVYRKAAALYLLVTVANVPGAVAATAAGCTRQNVSKLVRLMEDRRDDAALDNALDELERVILEGVV